MADFETRWREHVGQYRDDLALFAEDQFVLESGDPVVLADHQREKFRVFFRRDAAGRFKYQTIIDSDTKKSGKTAEAAMVGAWIPYVEPGEPECYAVANDLEQAKSRSFRMIETALRKNSLFAHRVTIRKSPRPSIEFPAGRLEAVPCDYAGESGSNPVLTLWTELWAYTSENARRLWAELTPSPIPLNSIRFIDTYAGFTGESTTLEALYNATVRSGRRLHATLPLYEDATGTIVAYWGYRERARLTVELSARDGFPALPLPESPRQPWQTPEYYEAQRAVLRSEDYDRLHCNGWQRSRAAFIKIEQWAALRRYDRIPFEELTRVVA